jgi:dipeptidyl aminopeptidase/acylaminoacyl peptidase
MSKIGYQRIAGHAYHPRAVQWWYFWEEEDGWAFARGGSCRTVREARHLIRDCHSSRARERARFLERPLYVLETDGSLTPITRSPYEAVRE